jgi:hypothetical protein
MAGVEHEHDVSVSARHLKNREVYRWFNVQSTAVS